MCDPFPPQQYQDELKIFLHLGSYNVLWRFHQACIQQQINNRYLQSDHLQSDHTVQKDRHLMGLYKLLILFQSMYVQLGYQNSQLTLLPPFERPIYERHRRKASKAF